MKGVVVNGLVGCDRYGNDGCWISGFDAAHRQAAVEVQHRRAAARNQAPRPGASSPTTSASAARPGSPAATIPISTSPTGASRRPSRGCARAAASSNFDNVLYTSSTVALRPKDGIARLALPARAGRIARSRRSVRARAGRHRRSESGVHDRQAGHPVEARSPQRQVPRLQGNDLPERLRVDRSEDRRADLSRRHPRAADRPVGRFVPEHRRRPQLAGDELRAVERRAGHSAQPVVHGDVGPQDRSDQRLGRHRRGSPLLRDARHRRQRRQARRLRRQDDEGAVDAAISGRRT